MDRNKWTANYHFSRGILQAGWNGFHQKLKASGLQSRQCSRTLYQFYLKPDRHSETASVFNSSNDLCACCLEFFESNHPRSYFLGSIKYGPSHIPLCWSKFILDRKYLSSFCFQFLCLSVSGWAGKLCCWCGCLDDMGNCAHFQPWATPADTWKRFRCCTADSMWLKWYGYNYSL